VLELRGQLPVARRVGGASLPPRTISRKSSRDPVRHVMGTSPRRRVDAGEFRGVGNRHPWRSAGTGTGGSRPTAAAGPPTCGDGMRSDEGDQNIEAWSPWALRGGNVSLPHEDGIR